MTVDEEHRGHLAREWCERGHELVKGGTHLVEQRPQVSDDYALRSWILGFGRLVRVIAPGPLVEWVEEELDRAHQH